MSMGRNNYHGHAGLWFMMRGFVVISFKY